MQLDNYDVKWSNLQIDGSRMEYHMGGCQNFGPFFGSLL